MPDVTDPNYCESCGFTHDGPVCVCGARLYLKGRSGGPKRWQHVHHADDADHAPHGPHDVRPVRPGDPSYGYSAWPIGDRTPDRTPDHDPLTRALDRAADRADTTDQDTDEGLRRLADEFIELARAHREERP